jgi:hypothetical protein
MGRGNTRRSRKPVLQDTLDATPERLKQAANEGSDPWEFVDPSRIDSVQPIGLVRRFRATHLDRWYKRDKPDKSLLTFRQWYAGDWYRSTHARAGFNMSVIASYGERTSQGEPSYGLARTEAQAQARDLWREGRKQFPKQIVGFMDRLLIHDDLPSYGGKQRFLKVRAIGSALDDLADWLRLARS